MPPLRSELFILDAANSSTLRLKLRALIELRSYNRFERRSIDRGTAAG